MITIEGLDIYEDTVVAQTKESQPLNNLEIRRRTYTNKITIPNTPKNQQAFKGGFSSVNVAVFDNGVPIATDVKAVEVGKDKDTRTIELRTPEFDLYEKLGDLTLGELFSFYDHEVDFYELQFSGASQYQYSIMDYGTGFKNNTVELEDCYPQIKWVSIRERLLSEKGININFPIGSTEQKILYLAGQSVKYDRVAGEFQDNMSFIQNTDWNNHGAFPLKGGRWTLNPSASYYRNANYVQIGFYMEIFVNGIFENSSTGDNIVIYKKEEDVVTIRTKPRITSGPQEVPPYIASITINAIPNNKWRSFKQMFPIKVTDVIKDLLQRYNAVITASNGTYEIVRLQPTFANVENWSRKYAGDAKANYKINGWARNNYFKEISGGRAGSITISDTLNYIGAQDVIVSPFHAPRNGTAYIAGNRIAKFPIITYDEEYKKIPNTEMGVGVSYAKKHRIAFTIVDNGSSLGVVSKSWQIMNPNEGQNYYDRVNVEYETLKREMKYPSYYSFYAFLEPQDISGILPRKVWIEQENSYFLVFKIAGYIAGKKTKIEALKILR